MLDELNIELGQIEKKLNELRKYIDLDIKQNKVKELESEAAAPGFWNDKQKAAKIFQELKLLKASYEPWIDAQKKTKDLIELLEIVEEGDSESINEIKAGISKLRSQVEKFEFETLMKDEEDVNNAIVGIHAGAGGTESCDWVQMLLRMYTRWAESKEYEVETIDLLQGEEAGLKNVTVIVRGEYAYGFLKSESGVHRLVRISPFDSNARRHTSFASVDVIPEIDEQIQIDIKDEDLRIETYRSSGPGGQHVNVTDSAVRIVHIPTGIVVQCQNERSQHKNKATAMKVLKARLYEKKKQERDEELSKKYGQKQEIAWGSQIRSYVMHPYSMVKDHRTDVETSDVEKVMNGDIDSFIEAYLKENVKGI